MKYTINKKEILEFESPEDMLESLEDNKSQSDGALNSVKKVLPYAAAAPMVAGAVMLSGRAGSTANDAARTFNKVNTLSQSHAVSKPKVGITPQRKPFTQVGKARPRANRING